MHLPSDHLERYFGTPSRDLRQEIAQQRALIKTLEDAAAPRALIAACRNNLAWMIARLVLDEVEAGEPSASDSGKR